MDKQLSDMTLEELWQLFPITLREYDPAWPTWFAEECIALKDLWGQRAARISHIGSTAVPGLVAKPIVDILLELAPPVAPAEVRGRLSDAGWLHMSGSDATPLRESFNKGYTPAGFAERVFHLHVRHAGDPDELYFRDHLRDHPVARDEYTRLKRSLAVTFRNDRDAYTGAKTAFIRSATAAARAEYGPRHRLPQPGGDR